MVGMKFYTLPPIAAALSLLLTGCAPADFADNNVVGQARQYFPLADVSHPQPGILQVNTYASNVSEMFAAKVMSQLIVEHQSELQFLPVVGYSVLRVSFDRYVCAWNTNNQYFVCGNASATTGGHPYSFYGTPLTNPNFFAPPMPPPPPIE